MRIYKKQLYKFMSIDGLKATLENKSLRFTRGDMFNDPYESCPYLIPLEWGDGIPEFTKNPELHSFLYHHAFARIFSNLYISCFTKGYKNEESKLMWSHYANNHSGVCIEFDTDLDPTDFTIPLEVTYVDSLVKMRDDLNCRSDPKDIALFLSMTKSAIWKYENEIRIVLYREGYELKHSKVLNSSDEDRYTYLPFDISKIKRIIFGVNSKKEDALEVFDLLAKIGSIVPFSKLIICPKTLNLIEDENIEKISDQHPTR